MMLAQAEGGFPPPLTELGAGVGGSTLAVLFLLMATLILLRIAYGQRRGRIKASSSLLRVDAQVELSPSQSLYLVRAAGRCLLVGGTSGSLALLAELDPAQVATLETEAPIAGGSRITMSEKLRALIRAPSR